MTESRIFPGEDRHYFATPKERAAYEYLSEGDQELADLLCAEASLSRVISTVGASRDQWQWAIATNRLVKNAIIRRSAYPPQG